MKKRTLFVVLFLSALLALLPLSGCENAKGDYFAPFAGGYVAEIRGTFRGIAFAAELKAGQPAPEGGRAATLTFYAPETLAGTVVARAADGALSLSVGGLTVTTDAAEGYRALIDIFPASGEVTEVKVIENGLTRVSGEGFSVDFRPDGSPAAAENTAAAVVVVRFSGENC